MKLSKDLILIGALAIFVILFLRQCESASRAEAEIIRNKNNAAALLDTVRNYRTKDGMYAAEIRGLELTLDEVKKDLKFEKNRPPKTIVQVETQIIEKIVKVPELINDTIIIDNGITYTSAMKVSDSQTWGKSSRAVSVSVPYKVDGLNLVTGSATIDLKQNIWLEASLSQDKKTKEVFVNVKSDYPGTQFNNLKGIKIADSEAKGFKMSMRKSLGIGASIGVGTNGQSFFPYIGVGLNYSPKFLQF